MCFEREIADYFLIDYNIRCNAIFYVYAAWIFGALLHSCISGCVYTFMRYMYNKVTISVYFEIWSLGNIFSEMFLQYFYAIVAKK